jgi:ribonuclease HI
MVKIIAFTDGSYNHKTKQCGYGVLFPNEDFSNISRPYKINPTSQRAELYAIYKAIQRISSKCIDDPILIYSDSEYSIKSLTIWIKNWKKNNWKTSTSKEVLNQDIIKKIDNLIQNYKGKIEFKHVRSHTGGTDYESINNDLVDGLAKAGALKT